MVSSFSDKTLDTHVDPAGIPAGKGKRRPRSLWAVVTVLFAAAAGFAGFRIFERDKANPDTVWEAAERDFMAGNYERVDTSLARLRHLREPTPLDHFLSAQLAMARGDNDQAIEYLNRVPDTHYMAAQARMLTGQTELRRDRVRLAEEMFHAALKLDPRLVQAHRELIYIYGMQLRRSEVNGEFTALSKRSQLTFDNVFHWGLLRNNTWEPGEEIKTLSAYIAADPTDRWSRIALAENYRRADRSDEAEAVLTPLPAVDPYVIDLKARIALDREGREEAEKLLAAGARDDPLLARLRGTLALSQRDAKTALAHFKTAYAADSENRETLLGLIAALELLGDKQTAVPYRELVGRLDRLNSLIQRASVKEARRNPGLMRELGAACLALGRKDEARSWYKLAIDIDPLDPVAQQALYRLNEPNHDGHKASGVKPAA
jgi:tetratricopeptide (TPR) repeat protein